MAEKKVRSYFDDLSSIDLRDREQIKPGSGGVSLRVVPWAVAYSELMKYDREVIQYVVLHEICHLRYMNHSNDFWNMVEKYMSNYKDVRKRLKS